jgi:hypothetical protein
MTDDDEKLHGPFTLETNERYQRSKCHDCAFHLFIQGSTKNKITLSQVKEGQDKHISKALFEGIKVWMLLWMNDIKSEEELQILYDCMMALIQEKDFARHFDPTFPDKLMMFFVSKIWCLQDLVSPRLFCTLQVHGSLDIWNVNIEFK